MAKVVAIATADWHLHKFRAFDKGGSRLSISLQAGQAIINHAKTLKVPVLFSGDLFHTPKEVENETMALTQKLFANNPDVDFLGISGNHDLAEKNSIDHVSPSHLDSFVHFPHFHKIDRCHWENKDLYVFGIPYMNNDADIIKAIPHPLEHIKNKIKILLLHSDAPGAMTPEGIKVGETEHIPPDFSVFWPWDLVLFGHIHKAQRLHDKAYMLGCPIHQNAGDIGNTCGYWEIYDDSTMKFKQLREFPKFVRLKKGELPREDGNYYVLPKEDVVESEVELGEFNISKSKKKLAQAYCNLKGIKNKSKRIALIKILNESE